MPNDDAPSPDPAPRPPASDRRYARDGLSRLIAIPSVSAEGRGLDEASGEVVRQLRELGFTVERHDTAGAPVVFARRVDDERAPTVLFYNHYDVQPADPLELWESEPFALVEREGAWYGRGVSDDKGQLVSRFAALRQLLDADGRLPVNATFVVEGEEEIGSPNLARYVETHADALACDGVVWEFGGVTADGAPMTYCGLKGIVCLELRVRTAGHDLHSSVGAVVENPIYRLACALAGLRDGDGRVLVEGFYDGITPVGEAEEALLRALPDEDAALARLYGVSSFLGAVRGTDFQRKLLLEPNLNINGFHSGYGGPGSKTVLPAEAFAKLDLRLVPGQDPVRVVRLLRAHLDRHGFSDIELVELETHEHAARSDVSHPFVRHTVDALRAAFGREPVVYPSVAGSGPMYPFVAHLGAPIVGLGCGYPGSRVHSPNEHVRVVDFDRSVRATVELLRRFGAA